MSHQQPTPAKLPLAVGLLEPGRRAAARFIRGWRRGLASGAAMVATALVMPVLSIAETFPSYRVPDSVPKSHIEFPIVWKTTWDETLAANGNEDSWRQGLAKEATLQPVADRIVSLRRAWLLEQMIGRFPQDGEKSAAACRRIAEAYQSLGDRTRSVHWLKRLADNYPQRADRAETYVAILRIATEDSAMPSASDWVQYAVNGIEQLVQAGAVPPGDPAVELARKRAYALRLAGGDYEYARRWLDRVDPEAKDPRWRLERASLMEAAGHRAIAADLFEAAGGHSQAEALRRGLQASRIDGIGKPMSRELEIRWNAVEDKRKGGKSVLEDPGLVQQTVSLAAESGSFWQASPSYRVQCWLAVDQLLRLQEPAAIKPFRKFQEAAAMPLIKQTGSHIDAQAAYRLFRSYPWSASVHKLLVETGEASLRANRVDEALRAFQQVLTHSDDPQLVGQARVGAWFASTELCESSSALEETMAAVPDNTLLSWRAEELPAVEVKNVMRTLLPTGTVAPGTMNQLRRVQIELPGPLAGDVPAAKVPNAGPQGVGALSVRRIEQTDDGIFIFGPRHAACYDLKTGSPRWFQVGNSLLDTPSALAFSSQDTTWPEGSWRPASAGSPRSTAVGPRRGLRPGETSAPQAVYQLLFHNLRSGTQFDVVAYDVQGGQVLWRSMDREEWRDLEPLSEPATADGRVYVVAWDARADLPCSVYLICLSGETGATIWKQPLGMVSAAAKEQNRALLSSAVTTDRGSVYVSTNMGIVASCDALDGNVQWVRTYASADASQRSAAQVRREGTPPLVIGNRVLVAPRDHTGVLAIDAVVGELLWEAPLVPSDQVIGAIGASLMVRGGRDVASLDLATGKEQWVRTVGEGSGARAVIAAPDVLVTTDDKLLRIAPANGAVVEQMLLARQPGSAEALLPDGTLVQLRIASPAVAAAKLAHTAQPQLLPLVEDWRLPCPNSRLVLPPELPEPTYRFAVLSNRQLTCVTTRPRAGILWQTILRDGADSVGFHGNLVVVARGAMLTALDATTGVTRWSLRLPFVPQVVGGDARVVFAGELSRTARVLTIDPESGSLKWDRRFGEEAAIGDGPLGWISLRSDFAAPPALILYWQKALVAGVGFRPGEMVVDAASGAILEVRPFLPSEPAWLERIVFGDGSRAYLGQQPFPLRAYQAHFRRDAIAFAGNGNVAHFVRDEKGAELAPGWEPPLDVASEKRYDGAVALFATGAGCYVKRLQELAYFDTTAKRQVSIKIPIAADMMDARTVLDLSEQGDALTVISQEPGLPVRFDAGNFTFTGLKDTTGKGDVSIQWLSPGAQVHHGRAGLAEAGVSPVATLLDGITKEHYRPQNITVRGINSLGWTKYDVFLYGISGKVTINGKDPQVMAGRDYKDPKHRTTFIRGINYLKFAEVSGDSFTLQGEEADYAAIQIADATQSAAAGRTAASLGINWTGGGLGLGPNDRVGAEVVMAPWYNLDADHGLSGGYQNHHVFIDEFDRATGALRKSQKVPVAPRDPRFAHHRREAAILADAIVITDAAFVYVLQRGAP